MNKHQANSEYMSTNKDLKPYICYCPKSKEHFVSVFFSKEFLIKKGFKIIK